MPKRTKAEQREYQLEWIKNRRDEWIKENGPCTDCGSWANLEVDHKDRTQKLYNVTSLWSLAIDNPKRISELAKCQVLCVPCHDVKTTKERGQGSPDHGTMKMYQYYRCRCDKCKECMKLYFREYRKRKRTKPWLID